MKKKLIFAIAMLILLLTSTGISYALFYFSTDSTVIKNICVDPIKENYEFSRSKYVSKDIFTVYFFPQPRYATGGVYTNNKADVEKTTHNQIINYDPSTQTEYTGGSNEGIEWTRSNNGRFLKNDGYFGPKTTTTPNYKPIVRTVVGSLTYKDFEAVGIPNCDMTDEKGAAITFSGWTANQYVAANLGYSGTGNYDLIQTHYPLSIIDQKTYSTNIKTKSVDGSNVGDGVIFLYPIYTAGKDYNGDRNVQLDLVNLKNSNGSFSQIMSTYNTTKDTSTNDKKFVGQKYISSPIHLSLNEVNSNVYYNIRTMLSYTNIAGLQWDGSNFNGTFTPVKVNNKKLTTSDKDLYNKKFNINKLNLVPDTTSTLDIAANTNPLYSKSREGDYTIYCYIMNNGFKTINTWPSLGHNYIPTSLKDKNITDIYHITKQEWRKAGWFTSAYSVEAYIYVEEKSNYKMVGGNSLSFDPYTRGTYVNTTNLDGTELSASNLIANNLDNIFTYYTDTDTTGKPTNARYKHQFKKSVFTIIPFSSNPSKGININYEIKIKNGLNNKYLATAVSSVTDSTNWDFKTDPNSQFSTIFNNKLIKFKEEGCFNIICTVRDKTVNGVKIKEITVDAEKVIQPLFIAIFAKKEDIKYSGNFIDFTTSAKPLYVSDGRFDNLTGFKSIYLGDKFNAQTTFVKNVNNQYTQVTNLKDIYLSLNPNETLYEIVSHTPIRVESGLSDTMFRCRVYYIGPKK